MRSRDAARCRGPPRPNRSRCSRNTVATRMPGRARRCLAVAVVSWLHERLAPDRAVRPAGGGEEHAGRPGLPGTGKSTLADGIGGELRLPVVSVDPLESAVLRAGIAQSFETGLAAYLVAEAVVDHQLGLGLDVIVDAVNAVEPARDTWRELARRHGARMSVFVCVLDRAEAAA